jgi:hypothetical protein
MAVPLFSVPDLISRLIGGVEERLFVRRFVAKYPLCRLVTPAIVP